MTHELVAAFTARLVRRISCSWTLPKVRSAQPLGSNTSCVFILFCITLEHVGKNQGLSRGESSQYIRHYYCLTLGIDKSILRKEKQE